MTTIAQPREDGQNETVVPPTPEISAEIGRYRHTDFFDVSDILTAEERAVRDKVSTFVDDNILPEINYYWENAEFPFDLVARWAELGLVGGSVKGYGSPGLTPLAEGLISMQLARGDGSMALINSVHSGMNMHLIDLLGSDEQKQRWLPSMARCEKLSAFALTEPAHGSDVVRMDTRAHREGDYWVLNGAKRWIGLGTFADLVLVWARDEDNGGVGCFVIERERDEEVPGYTATPMVRKTAMRAMINADITLENVKVPVENRIAGAHQFSDASRALTKSRQSIAWDGLGHAIAAYECALAYVMQREQFGKPLAKFQLIQDKLANMVADITGMQTVCVRLAQLEAQGKVKMEQAALAKLNTAAGARRVTAMARDMLGGNGVLLDYHVARHHCDVEGLYTFEGTDTVQSLIVGRAVTGMSAFA
ncbi:acyl-CoA dehydrogenase [Tsukamurella asaccharolytica]|uniref:Acyl-CoA dehydrogenase n=1 Tax=Tsukamurella asaccharolytica TaxID=2592067 RepID=A0A5C5RFC7_9ACTN|nr:acyl-CoA dehydrogenase family protein [Tsukamurella asaccharolytica]TWS21362.1 acyl-CoA dehydrogenase [Tsukamurella asaccharolytica]